MGIRTSIGYVTAFGAFLVFLVLTRHAEAATLDSERIAMIDAYALAAPSSAEASPTALANYLAQPMQSETEKARAIFRWVADRISYDVDAFFTNKLVTLNADQVLQKRISICDGYATLFEKLAHEAGLEAVTIKGYAKAYGHVAGSRFDKPNHAWNAVKIDGQWRLVDTTWGAGYVRGTQYVKVLTETYFLAPPEQMMFSHFPVNEAWQLQTLPHLSKAQFEAMPVVEPAFFHLGILGEEAWNTMKTPEFDGHFVRTFDLPFHEAIVQQAPLAYQLHIGQQHKLSIQSDHFEAMAVVQNDKWDKLQRDGKVFTSSMTPRETGNLMVVGKKPGDGQYVAILSYQVVP